MIFSSIQLLGLHRCPNHIVHALLLSSLKQIKFINVDITSTANPASAIIDVPAVEVPELTSEEQSDRLHLERKVERAFFEAGKALAELRVRP